MRARITIKKIQSILQRAGFDPGPLDGIKGARTTRALREFQKDNGLRPDGIVGPLTLRALGLEKDPQSGPMVMGTGKDITRIVIHATATPEGRAFTAKDVRNWHIRRGWSDIGYHFVIRLDGVVERGRPESRVGSHVAGMNTGSIGVVYVGGLEQGTGKAKDTRTPQQKEAMKVLVQDLMNAYPKAASNVEGHRDLSPDLDGDGVIEKHEWLKECPCFDVKKWLKEEGLMYA